MIVKLNNSLFKCNTFQLVHIYSQWQLNVVACSFQHDNAPVYKRRSVKTRCITTSVKELKWPAQSSDFNPN